MIIYKLDLKHQFVLVIVEIINILIMDKIDAHNVSHQLNLVILILTYP